MRQASLFDGAEEFVIDKPIRLIELFAGYGSQALSLKYLGANFEHWKISEWAVKSIQAYKDLHFENDNTDYAQGMTDEQLGDELERLCISSDYQNPMTRQQINRLSFDNKRKIYNNMKATHNLGSITGVHAKDLGIVDTDKYCYVMSYSYPCGLAGTKIITKNGYKNIEDVSTSDYVLTHKNRFCKVNKTMTRVSNHYYFIKGLGVPELYLTEEHPLYVLRDKKFCWVKVKDLKTSDKFVFNVNQNAIDADCSCEEMWLLGRYVADGWINKRLYNSVEFAIGYNKEEQFLKNIPIEYKERFKKFPKDSWEYRIADVRLQELCRQFGCGALNKKIPQWAIDLPKEKLQSFFNGYIAGDGHIRKMGESTQIMFTTVSETVFLGMQQIVAKLYGCICTCSIRKDKRKQTYNDTYNCQFNLTETRNQQLIVSDKICTKIKEIVRHNEDVQVYNFEVDKDNSYTCQNVIVHNCQSLSNAGKREGMKKDSGTTSSLLWEVQRILSETAGGGGRPQVLLLENVPQAKSDRNGKEFGEWYEFLESLGYKNYYAILNAKEFGIPQNRERIFMVSILGDYLYEFPNTIRLDLKTKDIQEPEETIAESYYLTDKQIKYILDFNHICDDTKRGDLGDRVVNPQIAKTISCRGAKDQRADITNFVVGDNSTTYTIEELRNALGDEKLNKVVCELALPMLEEGDCIDFSYSASRLSEIVGGGVQIAKR